MRPKDFLFALGVFLLGFWLLRFFVGPQVASILWLGIVLLPGRLNPWTALGTWWFSREVSPEKLREMFKVDGEEDFLKK